MVKLVWTEISRQDLKDIFDYICNDSQRYASITINKIYQRAQDIATNPRKTEKPNIIYISSVKS
ncbi:MAG: type II toxin-antitoxin system RelE/ParE family toxin [Bacteroidales bacterium]